MKKTIFVFSALIIALLVLFKISTYSIISGDLDIEIMIAFVAILSFFVGIYFNRKPKKNNASETKSVDYKKIKELEITNRELEVLTHISEGLSNKEIGEQLFLSESTIKTHVSNLLIKLHAKRRTQAVQKAKELNIIL
ncbi:LuxR C-terminal-related transcriptional regulator [Pseudotenacibaculum sp. MALMAid0570]|uniref:response regulator transcription factor n=1 Tax=Pseudotenacibaculum sp. MALMAid0570 TaxID=3143938 RepID=UPI0032DF3B7A